MLTATLLRNRFNRNRASCFPLPSASWPSLAHISTRTLSTDIIRFSQLSPVLLSTAMQERVLQVGIHYTKLAREGEIKGWGSTAMNSSCNGRVDVPCYTSVCRIESSCSAVFPKEDFNTVLYCSVLYPSRGTVQVQYSDWLLNGIERKICKKRKTQEHLVGNEAVLPVAVSLLSQSQSHS